MPWFPDFRPSRRRILAAAPWVLLPAAWGARHVWSADAQAPPANKGTFEEFTKQSEKSITRGTEWLMKTVGRDGACGADIGQQADIGCTSMAGLALMSQGNTTLEGPHSRIIRQMVTFMIRQVEVMPSDDITAALNTQLQNKIGRHAHSFFAALFLSQVVGEGDDTEPAKRALKKLVETIVSSQTAEGHWGQQSWAPVLGTVMGWVSLVAADTVGVKVGSSPQKTSQFLVGQMTQQLSQNQGSWMHTLYKNATGIRVLYSLGMENEPIAKRCFGEVETLVNKDNTPFSQAGGEEFLAFHLITETMLKKGGSDWANWYPKLRDKLIAVQNADGSWSGHHCITSRTFCTAAALLVLSSPNRYLPISQP